MSLLLPFLKSTVILAGASEWPLDPRNLPPKPSIENNVVKLIETFSNPNIIGISKNNFINLLNIDSPIDVLSKISSIENDFTNPLIFYYAGHGLIHQTSGELLLTTRNSTSYNAEIDAIKFSDLYRVISSKKRPLNLVILDSCFSGAAHGTLGQPEVIITGTEDTSGSIIITAVKGMNLATANPKDEYTAFTSCIIEILNKGIELGGEFITFSSFFEELKKMSINSGIPLPDITDHGNLGSSNFVLNRSKSRPFDIINFNSHFKRKFPKLLLVKNNSPNPIKDMDFGVPLGLWVLKSYLRRSGIIAEIYDERLAKKNDDLRYFNDIIKDYDIIGISACSTEVPESIRKLRIAKKAGKQTIIGGIFTFTNEEYLLSYPEIDYVIPGVATKPLYDLLDAMSLAKDFCIKQTSIRGVYCRDENNLEILGQKIWLTDTIPYFDKTICDEINKLYGKHLNKKISIITSRGCEHRCDFCTIQKETLRTPRTRNEDIVIQDICYLFNLGYEFVSIKDEDFLVDIGRCLKILEEVNFKVSLNGLTPKYKIKSRLDLLKSDIISKLAKLNVIEIQLGIETNNRTYLKHIKKDSRVHVTNILQTIQSLTNNGIIANCSFILGIDGEDPEYYKTLVDFCNNFSDFNLFKTYINFYTPHPFQNSFCTNGSQKIINNDLQCFNHKIPIVFPSTLNTRKERESMLECYDEIVKVTNSSSFNPPILEEFRNKIITAHNYFRENEIMKY